MLNYCISAAADEVEKENIYAAFIRTWFRPDSHRTLVPYSARRLHVSQSTYDMCSNINF